MHAPVRPTPQAGLNRFPTSPSEGQVPPARAARNHSAGPQDSQYICGIFIQLAAEQVKHHYDTKELPKTSLSHLLHRRSETSLYYNKNENSHRMTAKLRDLDPAVRRDTPDAVHQMRTTARRLRNCLRSYRSVLDRNVTDPIRRDLRWLARSLGAERDHEVLNERLALGVWEELPGELVRGPVTARLQAWDVAQRAEGRRRTLDALASPRYLELLNRLAALTDAPPLGPKAAGKPKKVMVKALLKEYDRLAEHMDRALEMPPGPERDAAIHHARKTAKRLRYAAETAGPALGKPAQRLRKRGKAVQQVSGDQHDGVVAREALLRMAVSAHTAGETAFTWGLLYGEERAAAGAR